jgi:glutamate receptor, ionotropic, plant
MVVWESSKAFTLFFLSLLPLLAEGQNGRNSTNSMHPFHVGVILDLSTVMGKARQTSISMAAEDFYAAHRNYSTRMAIHFRDSNDDAVQAAFQGT